MIGVTPTVTYPSHTTLITGVEPARHGIVDNRILDPENLSNGAWFWYTRDIKVPTVASLARAQGLRTAPGINWPVTVGMDLDVVVPEFYRSRHPEALSMLRALSTPRTLIDDVEAARGKPFSWLPTDDERAELAAYVVAKHDPHLLLVHLIDLDTAQHTYGPGSPQALRRWQKLTPALAGSSTRCGTLDAAIGRTSSSSPITGFSLSRTRCSRMRSSSARGC